VLSILGNLSRYVQRLPDEKRLQEQLLQFAEGGRLGTGKLHVFDEDSYVDRRCERLLHLDFVSLLFDMEKDRKIITETSRENIAKVLLAFATCPKNRGKLVQAGGVKILLSLLTSEHSSTVFISSHALAKIAISVDPFIAFRDQGISIRIVTALLGLLCPSQWGMDREDNNDSLQQFEALMALTNLTLLGDQIIAQILHTPLGRYKEPGLSVIEGLQLSSHELIQQAASELLCNLTIHSEEIISAYHKEATTYISSRTNLNSNANVSASTTSSNSRDNLLEVSITIRRLRVWYALLGDIMVPSEDPGPSNVTAAKDNEVRMETMRAAAGALAALSELGHDMCVLMAETLGVCKFIALTANSNDPQLQLRGLFVLMNFAESSPSIAKELEAKGALPVLKHIIDQSASIETNSNPSYISKEAVQMASQALRAIKSQ